VNRYLLLSVALLGGCFDSLVDNPCARGFSLVNGECVASDFPGPGPGEDDINGPDGGGGGDTDGGGGGGDTDGGGGGGGDTDGGTGSGGDTDGGAGEVCELPLLECDGECIDVSSDPDNCGACDHACASGICTAGHCEGDLSGHIVAIGHDYQSYHLAMARVLGNAAALGEHRDLSIALYRGATPISGVHTALGSGLSRIGRPFHWVTLPAPSPSALVGVDVLLVEPQTGDGATAEAAGAQWAAAIDTFLQRNGVVIVLQGAGGVSHRFAAGANLYGYTPVDSTNVTTHLVDSGDAIAQQVVTPYLAETTSVSFPGAWPVIAAPDGNAVVFHETRY
jgi:hypothetical protein